MYSMQSKPTIHLPFDSSEDQAAQYIIIVRAIGLDLRSAIDHGIRYGIAVDRMDMKS